jgi:predicted DsbA family dithiol-disulfide isomerase
MKTVNQNDEALPRDSNLESNEQNKLQDESTTVKQSSNHKLNIDIISDLICPWCFIGKRRLEKAITMLNNNNEPNKDAQKGYDINITWHPFQLNPNMPKGGIDRRIYRTSKFGSWEASQELDRHVIEAGLKEGI